MAIERNTNTTSSAMAVSSSAPIIAKTETAKSKTIGYFNVRFFNSIWKPTTGTIPTLSFDITDYNLNEKTIKEKLDKLHKSNPSETLLENTREANDMVVKTIESVQNGESQSPYMFFRGTCFLSNGKEYNCELSFRLNNTPKMEVPDLDS